MQDSRAHRFVVAGGLDGSVAVIWRNLVQPAPTFALVTRSADGVVTGQLLDEPFDLTAVPGGWVGSVGHVGEPHYLVRPDGTVLDLPVSDLVDVPAAGDVAVPQPQQAGYLIFRDGTLLHPDGSADDRRSRRTSPPTEGWSPRAGAARSSPTRADARACPRAPGTSPWWATARTSRRSRSAPSPTATSPSSALPCRPDSGLTWHTVELPADVRRSHLVRDHLGRHHGHHLRGVDPLHLPRGAARRALEAARVRAGGLRGRPDLRVERQPVSSSARTPTSSTSGCASTATTTSDDAPMQRILGRRRRVESSTPQ